MKEISEMTPRQTAIALESIMIENENNFYKDCKSANSNPKWAKDVKLKKFKESYEEMPSEQQEKILAAARRSAEKYKEEKCRI